MNRRYLHGVVASPSITPSPADQVFVIVSMHDRALRDLPQTRPRYRPKPPMPHEGGRGLEMADRLLGWSPANASAKPPQKSTRIWCSHRSRSTGLSSFVGN